ncbi:MAG: hypothetical protein HOO87_06290, partial [Methyloglobulus sp.]|nr:hypothetical protein [Methyloglobulus sp.]
GLPQQLGMIFTADFVSDNPRNLDIFLLSQLAKPGDGCGNGSATPRDGVCCPVIHVLPMASYTLKPIGQHAPSGIGNYLIAIPKAKEIKICSEDGTYKI